MGRPFTLASATLVAATLFTAAALAAPPPAAQKPAAGAAQRPSPRVELLQKELELDDATAQKLHAALEADRDEATALKRQRREAMKDIEALVQLKSTDDARYQQALGSLQDAHKKLATMKDARHARVAAVLKPHQQARMLVMMKHRKGKAMMKGPRGWGRGGPGGPDADDDDGPR